MRELISQHGSKLGNGSTLEDFKLACLAVIVDIPNIKHELREQIKKSRSVSNTRSVEFFLFLLSLVQNREYQREPVFNYYLVFGSRPGRWHRGRLGENLLSAIEGRGLIEYEQLYSVNEAIREATNVISELDRFDFISNYDSTNVKLKLEEIKFRLTSIALAEVNESYIGNLLIDSNLFKILWPYAQSDYYGISDYVRQEIKSFVTNFENYYEQKKKIKDVKEDWQQGAPEIIVKSEHAGNLNNNYLFFKPFRDFIRDAIYNSIWAMHGIEAGDFFQCSMLITLRCYSDTFVIDFANCIHPQDAEIKLHSKAYQTKINILDGEFFVKIEADIYTVSLLIPTISNFLPKEI